MLAFCETKWTIPYFSLRTQCDFIATKRKVKRVPHVANGLLIFRLVPMRSCWIACLGDCVSWEDCCNVQCLHHRAALVLLSSHWNLLSDRLCSEINNVTNLPPALCSVTVWIFSHIITRNIYAPYWWLKMLVYIPFR